MKRPTLFLLLATVLAAADGAPPMPSPFASYRLDTTTAPDAALQATVEAIDIRLREKHGLGPDQTAVGVLDLNTGRLALVRPNQAFYAASVPKIAILLAWFQAHPEAATTMDAATRHELGLMIKASDNVLATKYSQLLGLAQIQKTLGDYGLYDAKSGGIWMGKHYGKGGERLPDPLSGNSHAANVRQLLRFYLLLEQDRLVSPAASAAMREIFTSPDIPHRDDKFVLGLARLRQGYGGQAGAIEIRRKAGWWEDWFHDSAVVTGGGRRYVIVALTHHAKGDAYLADYAAAVDDALTGAAGRP